MELLGQLSKSSLYIDYFQSIEYFLPVILSISYIICFSFITFYKIFKQNQKRSKIQMPSAFMLLQIWHLTSSMPETLVIFVLLAWPKVVCITRVS